MSATSEELIVKLAPAESVYVKFPSVPPAVLRVITITVFAVTVVFVTVTVPATSVALPARCPVPDLYWINPPTVKSDRIPAAVNAVRTVPPEL